MEAPSRGGDFARNHRLIQLSAFALVIGVISLMARFGSEKIRGHGIPEAIEAILFGKSRMVPKIAILKPLSSGIAIGSGEPRALGSGTSGGVLAPLLMIGAGLGSVMGSWLPGAGPEMWALVCMAAILASTMRAPLTALVFAVELTQDVNAFLPTLLSCAVAYGFTVIVMPRSTLTEKIARRGRHVYREYGVDPLERHFVDEVMTRDPLSIAGSLTPGEILSAYFGQNQRHRAYPVWNYQPQRLARTRRGSPRGRGAP